MSKKLISIIVPCYNQAQYLDECLQSVLDQTFKDWECIIVSDGSPDNTEQAAQKWVDKDSRFELLVKENGGLSSARNAGIEIAKGEWILPLDADDKIGNQYLELAEKEFKNAPKLIYGKAVLFENETGEWRLGTYSYDRLLVGNIIYCSSLFTKKDWQTIGKYDESLLRGMEDWDFWLRLLDTSSKVSFINEIVFHYRVKSNSMVKDTHKDQQNIRNIKDYVFEKNKEKYISSFGDYFDAISRLEKLQRDNQFLIAITESKRFKLCNKIFAIFDKLRP